MISVIEDALFRHRGLVLALIAAITLASLAPLSRVTLDTAVATHLPAEHEFIRTFLDYEEELLGTDRVLVVVRPRKGDIWNVAALRRLKEVTDALAALPDIDRRTVTSLWTPNVTYMELTEEGLHTEDIVDAGFTVDSLDAEEVARIRERVLRGGLHGRLTASDHSAALVVGSTTATNPETGKKPDRLQLAARLETDLRQRFSDDAFEIHLVGVPTMMAAIAAGVKDAIVLLLPLALLVTLLLLRVLAGRWRLAALPLLCSLVALVWQFGLVGLLGWGFDPLTLLLPFLVLVTGAIHGIAQAQVLAGRAVAGDDAMTAARAVFRRTFLPGSLALLATALALLVMAFLPIHTVRAAGVTAAFGAAGMILSNLVLLPLLTSYGRGRAGDRVTLLPWSEKAAGLFGACARRGPALLALAVGAALLAVAAWQLPGRHFGDEHPGATELRPGARYNQDANLLTGHFDIRMDLFLLLVEVPRDSCTDYEVIDYLDRLTWHMQNVPGVHSVMSATPVARYLSAMWNEGNPKWSGLPRNRYALMQVMSSVPAMLGVFNPDCSVMQVQVFTDDHREQTVRAVTAAARQFQEENPSERIRLRLASGGIAVQAATNEVLAAAELPMLLWPLAAVLVLATLAWRDWRAALACAAPPALATLLGYAVMIPTGTGVTTATLPMLALGSGIGATFTFYLWDSLRVRLTPGAPLPEAWPQTLRATGGAVTGMALVLAGAAAVWWFSTISALAEAGRLLLMLLPLHWALSLLLLPALAALTGADTARGRGRGLA